MTSEISSGARVIRGEDFGAWLRDSARGGIYGRIGEYIQWTKCEDGITEIPVRPFLAACLERTQESWAQEPRVQQYNEITAVAVLAAIVRPQWEKQFSEICEFYKEMRLNKPLLFAQYTLNCLEARCLPGVIVIDSSMRDYTQRIAPAVVSISASIAKEERIGQGLFRYFFSTRSLDWQVNRLANGS